MKAHRFDAVLCGANSLCLAMRVKEHALCRRLHNKRASKSTRSACIQRKVDPDKLQEAAAEESAANRGGLCTKGHTCRDRRRQNKKRQPKAQVDVDL